MLRRRPLNVGALWGNENVGLVSGRDIFAACRELGGVALAANCRHPLTAKGVLRAAKKLNAAVVLEIMLRRFDRNAAPERSPIHPRSDYGADRAPNRLRTRGDFEE